MDESDETGLAAVVADIGANLVSILLILLAIAIAMQGHERQTAPKLHVAELMPSLSGRAQSDLLYQRLNSPPDTALIEVTRQGATWLSDGKPRPLADLPIPPPGRAVIFVLAPAQYATLRAMADRLPAARVEMTVPLALQRQDGKGFSPAFLSLRTGPSPDSIRPGLQRLLLQGGQGVSPPGNGTAGNAGFAFATWFWPALRLAGNLTLFALTLLLLRALWSRTRPSL